MVELTESCLQNLINLKNEHKKICNNSECSISIYQLKILAEDFVKYQHRQLRINSAQALELKKKIDEETWT